MLLSSSDICFLKYTSSHNIPVIRYLALNCQSQEESTNLKCIWISICILTHPNLYLPPQNPGSACSIPCHHAHSRPGGLKRSNDMIHMNCRLQSMTWSFYVMSGSFFTFSEIFVSQSIFGAPRQKAFYQELRKIQNYRITVPALKEL